MYLNPSRADECLVLAYDMNKTAGFVPVGDGISSKPNPIRQSRNTNAKSTVTKSSTANHKLMNYLQAGKILSAAEKLPGYYHWANFVYNESYREENDGKTWARSGAWLIRALAGAFAIANHRRINKRSLMFEAGALEDLAQMCFIDYTHRLRCEKQKYGPTDICQHVWGKSPDDVNWYRGIAPHFDYMTIILQRHNQAVLDAVSRVIAQEVSECA